MKKHRPILLIPLVVAVLGGLAWLLAPASDPLFHGKRESEWIRSVSYGGSLSQAKNQEQVKRWRDFGPDGIRVLVRGVDRADRPSRRFYRRIHRHLAASFPHFLMRLLPD